MKIQIPGRDLAGVLKYTGKVVERRNTIPILGNVLLKADKDKLSVKMTDLDIEVTASVACEVSQPGATTVPAVMTENIVKKLKPDSVITLDQDAGDGRVLNVKAARSRFKLQTLPESDFPDLSIGKVAHTFELPTTDIQKLLHKPQFCVSTEESRYYLNGIYLHHHQNGQATVLRGVSTDGHRLARVECPAPQGADTFHSNSNTNGVIVPYKTCDLLSKMIADGGVDKVGIQLSDSKAMFTLGGTTVASKLIDGTFPDYQRVIPTDNDRIMRCDRAELAEAVDRLSVVSERGRVVRLTLTKGKAVIDINNPDLGSATEELDVEYAGADIQIGFNSLYLKEILANVEGDQTEMRLADPGTAVVIVGVNKPDVLFVQMPMRA